MARQVRAAAFVLGFAVLAGCDNPFPPGAIVRGMFGGNNAGLMADDTSAHLHISCTYGDVHQPIVLDLNSRFDVPGEQNITAHPVDLGILHPARFTGSIDGRTMTLTVTLTDTTVTLGPVVLTFNKQPNMGDACPICFGKRARARAVRLTLH
jgi:hypothetical protein